MLTLPKRCERKSLQCEVESMETHTGSCVVILKKEQGCTRPLGIVLGAPRANGWNCSHLETMKEACLGPVPSLQEWHDRKTERTWVFDDVINLKQTSLP